MKPVAVCATAAWIVVLSIAGPTTAQHSCAGVDVVVGAREHRCTQPGAGQSFKDCAHCPEMVVVPRGAFTMGAPLQEERHPGNSEREDQVPVQIERPFAVGRYAVTRGEFAAFAAATGIQ